MSHLPSLREKTSVLPSRERDSLVTSAALPVQSGASAERPERTNRAPKKARHSAARTPASSESCLVLMAGSDGVGAGTALLEPAPGLPAPAAEAHHQQAGAEDIGVAHQGL